MKAFAIDFGGSHATCALVDEHSVLGEVRVDIPDNSRLLPILPKLSDAILAVAARAGIRTTDAAGLAFGFCGLVNTREHRILATNGRYADAHEIHLQAWARESLDLPLALENDARLALLGERQAGAAQGCDDVVMITLGTGVGGAAMMEGHLIRGKHFQAGCLGGHFPVRLNGWLCSCGNIGCVEAEASGLSLPTIAKSSSDFYASALASEPTLGFRELIAHAVKGDVVAKKVFEHCRDAWNAGAVALIHAYDPELVIVGGGVVEGDERDGPTIVPSMRAHVEKHAWTPWGKVQVKPAALGNRAALLGAVPLVKMNQGRAR